MRSTANASGQMSDLRAGDPLPYAEGRRWRREAPAEQAERVLRSGSESWRGSTPTAVEFAVVALGLEGFAATGSVLLDEAVPQFWTSALGVGLPGRAALPDDRFVHAFLLGVRDGMSR